MGDAPRPGPGKARAAGHEAGAGAHRGAGWGALRLPAVVAAAGAGAWMAGVAPPGVAALGLGWFAAVGAWRGHSSWRDPAAWPEPVVRRGVHPGRAGLFVDVPRGEEDRAEAVARALQAAGAGATFFLAPEATAAAEGLAARGFEVAWLGLAHPSAPAEVRPLPPGASWLGRPSARASFWRPRGVRPSAAERELGRITGYRLVAPTLTLRDAAPDGLTVVATDLVQVPLALPAPRLAAWVADCDARAVCTTTVGAVLAGAAEAAG